MTDEQQDERGFRVTDRRRFTESGETRSGQREAEQGAPPAEQPTSPEPSPPTHAAATEPSSQSPEPDEPVTFASFVLGLSTQALFHLGEIAEPGTGSRSQDLEAAKHIIDLLGILRDKTRNNLEQSEEALLESILYDLRMRYVELVRR